MQEWFTQQNTDGRAGAEYFLAHPNAGDFASCSIGAGENYSGNLLEFANGCTQADTIFGYNRQRRISDPEYRAGFSDEAKRRPLFVAGAESSPSSAMQQTTAAQAPAPAAKSLEDRRREYNKLIDNIER
jgi:hypothetical protein